MRYPHRLLYEDHAQGVDQTELPAEDAYGQPVETTPTPIPFKGFLQPVSSMEIRQANDAGVAIGTHRLFAPITLPASKNGRVRWDLPNDDRIYLVDGDPRDAAGRRHHLEMYLRFVHL